MANIRNLDPFFRGWAKPGPLAHVDADVALEPGETLDALSGHFRIFQLKEGHRFSTDDILTAWYGTSWAPSVGRALDLGSGIGSVAMVAAWRLRHVPFVTVEAQEESVRLARKSATYNGLNERFEIRHGDFRDPQVLGPDERFDLVLGSPPYFPLGTGVHSEHPQRLACRFEVRGDVADYCRVAAEHLAPGGLFACVFPCDPPEQLARVEEGAREAGLSIIRRRDVMLDASKGAYLALFAMQRRGDLPEEMRDQTWIEPPLIIRDADGALHPEYQAIKMSFGFPP